MPRRAGVGGSAGGTTNSSRTHQEQGVGGAEDLFAAGAWRMHQLDVGDEPAVQGLAERCADYFALVEGRPPSATAAREFFAAAPEGRRPEDVLKLGVVA